MTREQILAKYPEVQIRTEDMQPEDKKEDKDDDCVSENDSLKFSYNEKFKADSKEDLKDQIFQSKLDQLVGSKAQIPQNQHFSQPLIDDPVDHEQQTSEKQDQQIDIIQSLPNLKSLDSRKETQSNYNEYHQKINLQEEDKIQLHSQEAKQEQVTVPILKESEIPNFTQKKDFDNIS